METAVQSSSACEERNNGTGGGPRRQWSRGGVTPEIGADTSDDRTAASTEVEATDTGPRGEITG